MAFHRKDLTDCTFLIPYRGDSLIRLENLSMVTRFIKSNFRTNIHVLEADNYNNNFLNQILPKETLITFIEDPDPIFHRTRYINMLVENCTTPFLAIWDADVVVSVKQILNSIRLLRKNKASFVYPYKENFCDVSSIIRELYFQKRDIEILLNNAGKMKRLYLPNPVGGCFMAKTTTYKKSGVENENFYGWGREDGDRMNRWNILDFNFKRISGPLFHLTHERGTNSKFHSEEQKNIKISEIMRIASMSKEELINELEKW